MVKIYKDGSAAFTSANSDTTVYKVSANRVFYLTNVAVANDEASNILVTLFDGAGGDKKAYIIAPADDTKPIKTRIKFTDSVVAQVNTYTDGSYITISGYEE